MSHPAPSIFLLSLVLLGACAPKVPTELASARAAYTAVSTGPAMTLVPTDVHLAKTALDAAEASFADDPRGYHTLDLAYVAWRTSEIAEVRSDTASSAASLASSNASIQLQQDAIMLDTRGRLDTAVSDLATSEQARKDADARAAAAADALAKLAAVKQEERGLVITLSGSVLFASDESALLPAAETRLAQVSTALMETSDRLLTVEGHTDSQGADAYNIDLSQRRADVVRSFLVAHGYPSNLVRAVGVGEGRPVATNDTAEGRANNRRVELIIAPLATAAR